MPLGLCCSRACHLPSAHVIAAIHVWHGQHGMHSGCKSVSWQLEVVASAHNSAKREHQVQAVAAVQTQQLENLKFQVQ